MPALALTDPMRALVFDASGPRLATVDPPVRSDECLIRVSLAGICGTDLQLLAGYAAFTGVPGHEFVGIVESAPREHVDLVGRRVVGEINAGCRRCRFCRIGVKEHCSARTVLGIRERPGAFAEFLSLPASNLHLVPDSLTDQAAVFVEPAAAAFRIGEQVPVDRSTRAAVVGDGRLGLLVAQALRVEDADVTVVGRHPAKLEVARRLGLATIPGESLEPPPREFDLVVDATGRPAGLAAALDLVRPCGTVVLKTTCHGDSTLALSRVAVDEVTIVGSRCGPFAPALRALADGRIQTAPLVERTYPLEEFEAAFAAARQGLKVLFRTDR